MRPTGSLSQLFMIKFLLNKITDKSGILLYFQNPEDYGASLSNAIFHCEVNCTFIAKTIEMHSQMFSSSDWASGGSKLFTKAMKSICTIPEVKTNIYFVIFLHNGITTRNTCYK